VSTNEWILDTPSSDDVANASFQLVRKGFDPFEVQNFARAAGAELERLKGENERLRTSLERSEARANVNLDEDSIANYLGEETTRLLSAARETSQAIVGRADAKAKETLDTAFEEAAAIRLEASTEVTAERRQAADESRRLVSEAKAHRRKMLKDLASRRDVACTQLGELLKGRDLLAQTLGQIADTATGLISRLDAISAAPSDFVNLDPELDSDGSEMDPIAVLQVTQEANGHIGNRDTLRAVKPGDKGAPSVGVDSEPIMAFNS
jgi:cell division septum initiation protein DivIVA